MRTLKVFLLILLTLSLTNCTRPGPTNPDVTVTPAPPATVTPLPPDLVTASVPTVESPTPAVDNIFASAQLTLVANIETAGIVVSGGNFPATAELHYRPDDDAAWVRGHPLVRIDDGRLVGSLFGLSLSTSYSVKISDGQSEIGGVVTTQPNELTFTSHTIIHVDDDAPEGGDGSVSAPFRTIQEGVDHASAGTQVLVADGVYHEAVTFPSSGTAEQWIQIKAAGAGAILDGSTNLAGVNWDTVSGVNKVWFIKGAGSIGYLSRDRERFYNYNDLASLKQSRGHGNVTIREGWYHDPRTARLYVRSQNHPSNHSWQFPTLNHAFDINDQDWIWIEGFEIRHYGTQTDGCGVCTLNASHIVIRKNRIHNLQLGIFINWNGNDSQGNDTRIEQNEIYDPTVDKWAWGAVKGTSMEGTGIVLRGHAGAIVRENNIHNYFNGIYTGSSAALENTDIAFDADIYNNHIHEISDDGLEPEGACINQRFRNNRVDNMLVGVSIAPVTHGPTWVIRNLFTNFTGTSLKWALNPDGYVLVYHNTSWTNAPGLNAMSLITPVRHSILRNNIFYGNGYAFEEIVNGSMENDWNNNNWFTTRVSSMPHFKWENVNYQTLFEFCVSTGMECNGHESAPGLVNALGGDFTLLPSSPNLDRGVVIPGINDSYTGTAPDIGATESPFVRASQ